MEKDKRVVKPKKGVSPPILGKGCTHKVRTKYSRKAKHKKEDL